MTAGLGGIPAWKRLGLKLKYANEVSDKNGSLITETPTTQVTPKESQSNGSEPPKKKRKFERKDGSNRDSTPLGSTNTNTGPDKALKKQVSFSADTKSAAPTSLHNSAEVETPSGASQSSINGEKFKTKKKKKTMKLQQGPAQKSNRALDYLDQYHSDLSSWKYNKNRETWILKHVFSEVDIPRNHNLGLAEYVHGLQGTGARERLKTQCTELLRKAQTNKSEDEDNNGDLTRDEMYVQRLKSDLNKPANSEAASQKDDAEDEKYTAWIQHRPRPTLIWWALGLQNLSNSAELKSSTNSRNVNGVERMPKKPKNRTTLVAYDSSSSSSSSSSSDSESEGESEGEENGTVSSGGSDEETSSSGSSDSESSSGSEDS